MGNKVRHLLGSAFIRSAILIFILVIGARGTFGDIVIINGFPPPGYVKVVVDGPDSIKSAIQWKIGNSPNNLVFSD